MEPPILEQASPLVDAGLAPRTIVGILRHLRSGLAMNAYTHVFTWAQREAAASTDRFIPDGDLEVG